jgi:AcrR family transcriptional regulator
MNRKIAERCQRKKAILDGALKSYSKNGIDGITMDNIALESDFGKATIYYYFPSKEDIICSLMEMGWQDLWESVEEMVIEDVPARKKFVKILNQMADIVFQNRVLYEFLFTVPRNMSIPDNKASWKVFQNRTYATLQSIVDEGMDQGDFADIKPDLFMKAVGGIFHGIVFMGEQKKLEEKDIESLISNFIYPS